MRNRIHQAFDSVKANAEQKQVLKDYLAQQRSGTSQKHTSVFMRAAVILSAVLLCIAAAGLYLIRTTAYTVHINTSPAVVLDLNRFDRVISITAFDSEKTSALEELSVKGMTCPEAVNALLDTETLQASLIKNPEPAVTVEGQTEEQATRICTGIRRQVRARCEKSKAATDIGNENSSVSPTEVPAAPSAAAQHGIPQRKQLRKHGGG